MTSDRVKRIPIAAEIADDMATRLFALQGRVQCVRSALEGCRDDPNRAPAIDALWGVAHELERIAVDLDVCTWEDQEPEPVAGDGPPALKVLQS
jgi:hypothetical protein